MTLHSRGCGLRSPRLVAVSAFFCTHRTHNARLKPARLPASNLLGCEFFLSRFELKGLEKEVGIPDPWYTVWDPVGPPGFPLISGVSRIRIRKAVRQPSARHRPYADLCVSSQLRCAHDTHKMLWLHCLVKTSSVAGRCCMMLCRCGSSIQVISLGLGRLLEFFFGDPLLQPLDIRTRKN